MPSGVETANTAVRRCHAGSLILRAAYDTKKKKRGPKAAFFKSTDTDFL